jgi:Derlin-2/3
MAELNVLEQWYYDVPIVTRVWTTAAVLTSVLVQCQVVTPFQLFFSISSVWGKRQVYIPLALCFTVTDDGTRSTGAS